MEKKNRIVLKELVEQHKPSRLLAMQIRDQMNAAAITAHGDQAGPAPESLNHKDDDVLDALYAALKADEGAHPECVDAYDKKAKQYTEHNG